MGFHYDPEADKRSLMLKQKALCNGQRNGRACVHYWTHVEKVESANSDNLRRGEIYRSCVFPGGGAPLQSHEMSADQLATECNQFKARRLPILQRPLAWLGMVEDQGKYDPEYEDYKPLSPEEIKTLQAELPTPEADENAVVGGTPEAAIESFKKDFSLDDAMSALDDNSEDGGIFKEKN